MNLPRRTTKNQGESQEMNVMETTASSKVAKVTLLFWIVKILATTLGETGGDALSMTLELGYAASSLIFGAVFLVALAAQLASSRMRPALYWTVIVATTTVGTTLADLTDRSLGIGYVGGSLLLLGLTLASLATWRLVVGSVSVDRIVSRKAEVFYWFTILFSNTLGTALGDFLADESGLGFLGAASVFAALLVLVAAIWFFTEAPRDPLFWAAFVLTRPLGATLGDLLTKTHEEGGFELGRFASTAVIALAMIGLVVYSARRDAARSGA
jgi:uncharacterized membrane-anchored protein